MVHIHFQRPTEIQRGYLSTVIIHLDSVEDLAFNHFPPDELREEGRVQYHEFYWHYGRPDGDEDEIAAHPPHGCREDREWRPLRRDDDDRDREPCRNRGRDIFARVTNWMEGRNRGRSNRMEVDPRSGYYRGESSRRRDGPQGMDLSNKKKSLWPISARKSQNRKPMDKEENQSAAQNSEFKLMDKISEGGSWELAGNNSNLDCYQSTPMTSEVIVIPLTEHFETVQMQQGPIHSKTQLPQHIITVSVSSDPVLEAPLDSQQIILDRAEQPQVDLSLTEHAALLFDQQQSPVDPSPHLNEEEIQNQL